MFKIHIILDEEKIKREDPETDIKGTYQNIRKYLMNPKYKMTEVKVDEGIMFQSDRSEKQYFGIAMISSQFEKNTWFRKYLKKWCTYDNLGLNDEDNEAWNYEDCLKEMFLFEKKYNADFTKNDYGTFGKSKNKSN